VFGNHAINEEKKFQNHNFHFTIEQKIKNNYKQIMKKGITKEHKKQNYKSLHLNNVCIITSKEL
jgi:hypothetical protein